MLRCDGSDIWWLWFFSQPGWLAVKCCSSTSQSRRVKHGIHCQLRFHRWHLILADCFAFVVSFAALHCCQVAEALRDWLPQLWRKLLQRKSRCISNSNAGSWMRGPVLWCGVGPKGAAADKSGATVQAKQAFALGSLPDIIPSCDSPSKYHRTSKIFSCRTFYWHWNPFFSKPTIAWFSPMTWVFKSLPPSAAVWAPLRQILQPIAVHWSDSLPTFAGLFFISVKSFIPLCGGSYFKVKGQVWLYLNATLNYSGCGKAPVVEQQCVKISHCGFSLSKMERAGCTLKTGRSSEESYLLFFFVVDSLHSRQRLILAWTRNSQEGSTFLKLLKLRWFYSTRACQSPSVRSFEFMHCVFFNCFPFCIQSAIDFVFMGNLPHS